MCVSRLLGLGASCESREIGAFSFGTMYGLVRSVARGASVNVTRGMGCAALRHYGSAAVAFSFDNALQCAPDTKVTGEEGARIRCSSLVAF